MNHNSVFVSVGILLASSLLIEARAQSPATGVKNATAPQTKRSGRPISALSIRSDFLKTYVPSVPGLPGVGGGGGSSMKGTHTPDPLEATQKDPSFYQKKRRAPQATVPKARNPAKPRELAVIPARPGQARNDRTFVNGLTPQSIRYLRSESSKFQREPDRRAELAKVTAPNKPKTRAASRSFSSNAPKPRRSAAK